MDLLQHRLLFSIRKFIINIKLKIFGDEIFYVNGPQTLPPPLQKDEEDRYLKKISAGDITAREILITHNLRLVVYIAKKFENT